jgi:MFS family permease
MCRSPVLPLFARQLGASPELVGFVVGASTLTGIFLKFPAGTLSDVIGRKTMLLAAGAVFATLPFMYLGVASVVTLILIRLVHGGATAIFGPVASATVSDLAPVEKRGHWLGWYSTAQGVGQALGPVLAGSLIVAVSFDRAFLASGLIGLMALGVAAFWPRTSSHPESGSLWQRFKTGIVEVARDRRVLTTSVAQAAQFFLNGSLNAFLPLYAAETIGLNAFRIGMIFGVQTVGTLVARPWFGAISDRAGRRPVIVSGLLACATAIAMLSFAAGFASLLAAALAYGIGLAITTSATAAYVTDLSKRTRYGAAHGVFGTIYDVGDAAGPIAAGFLVAAFGYRGMFRVIATVAVTLAGAFFWLSRDWMERGLDCCAPVTKNDRVVP